MKSYREFNESVRDQMTPKSEEEINLALESAAKRMLDEAEKSGTGFSAVEFLSPKNQHFLNEYILAKDFIDPDTMLLLYNGTIYKLSSVPGGNYYTRVDVINNDMKEFKTILKQIQDRLQ